ncbi:MAG: hypothetical protein NT178_07930 [Proteobacteria bacterium]|nr:hypothetical protein [Pseudomonadota bacterium]MCX5812460.1 hypothetical protein [Pseudomonadota bacterium]
MALDEPQKDDMVFTDHGITFTIDKNLFEEAKPVSIDFVESLNGSGFAITSNLPTGGGCC